MISKSDIKKAVLLRKGQIGIKGEIKSIKVSRIGMGENNLNFLVAVNKSTKLVFRVALRKSIEKNMEKEFNNLKMIPNGFGPEPLYFDKSRRIIPKYYSIFRYIEGKHIKRWLPKHFRMHAKKLADLHRRKSSYWGREKNKSKFDIYKLFIKDIKVYKKDSPDIFDNEMNALLSKVKDFLKEKNHFFTSLRRFSLVHKDPCITNILLTKAGIMYIDWEWACYWDNALDVAMLYDPDYSQPPWKMKLKGKKLGFYLNTYLRYNKDKTLKERANAWVVFLKGIDLIFFKWKTKYYEKGRSDQPRKVYAKNYEIVANSIRKLK